MYDSAVAKKEIYYSKKNYVLGWMNDLDFTLYFC